MPDIGIIGFGKMGRIRAQAIEAEGAGRIRAVYDPEHRCVDHPSAASAEQIIGDPDVGAVFICTPNHLNRPLTCAALRAGKHVFCEKPPAFNADEVAEIRAVEAASGRVLMYGFNHRHHRSIHVIKDLVDSGEYGRILWLRGRYGKSVDTSFYDDWRARRELAGGGILLDQGIHMLDLFLHLAGGFDQVQAMISNLYWKLDIEDNAFVLLGNSETGVVASLHSTMTQWRHLFSLEVFLEKGYLVLNGLKTPSGSYGQEELSIAKNRSTAPAATWDDEERMRFETDLSWRSEIRDFFAAIAGERPVVNGTSADAARLMRVIDQIYACGGNR